MILHLHCFEQEQQIMKNVRDLNPSRAGSENTSFLRLVTDYVKEKKRT